MVNHDAIASSSRTRPIPDVPLDLNKPAAPPPRCDMVVVGAGGHGRELADIIRDIENVDGSVALLGVVDDGSPDRIVLARSGLRFLGSSSALSGREVDVHIGIGDPATRRRIDETLDRPARALIHPTATVGSACRIEAGVVVAQGAIVTTNVTLGRHTHLNVGVTVAHDGVIGTCSTLCPGVTVAGNVSIGTGVFVGAGATILPGVSLGDGAIIGAGAVVTADVKPNTTVAGVPARPITS